MEGTVLALNFKGRQLIGWVFCGCHMVPQQGPERILPFWLPSQKGNPFWSPGMPFPAPKEHNQIPPPNGAGGPALRRSDGATVRRPGACFTCASSFRRPSALASASKLHFVLPQKLHEAVGPPGKGSIMVSSLYELVALAKR